MNPWRFARYSCALGLRSKSMAASLAEPGSVYDRRVTVRGLIIDWGGVLTTPLKDAIKVWITADGIDHDGYRDVMREWFDGAYAAGGAANPVHGLEDGSLDP